MKTWYAACKLFISYHTQFKENMHSMKAAVLYGNCIKSAHKAFGKCFKVWVDICNTYVDFFSCVMHSSMCCQKNVRRTCLFHTQAASTITTQWFLALAWQLQPHHSSRVFTYWASSHMLFVYVQILLTWHFEIYFDCFDVFLSKVTTSFLGPPH